LVEYNGISLYAFRVYGTAVTTGIISSAKKSGYLLGLPKGMVISDPRQMQYGLDGKAKRTKQKPIKTLSPNSKDHTLSQ
jgi:hypothetical protein